MTQKIILFFILTLFLTSPFLVLAQAVKILPTPSGSCPAGLTCQNGICVSSESQGAGTESTKISCNYSLNDFLVLGMNIANFIFGIIGSLALLVFIVGGLTWLTSGGVPDRIKKGKEILTQGIIGLIITLGAALIVNLVKTILNVNIK